MAIRIIYLLQPQVHGKCPKKEDTMKKIRKLSYHIFKNVMILTFLKEYKNSIPGER